MTDDGLVLELQRDCLDQSISISTLLRRAKVIAAKLELNDLRDWIDSELSGYECSLKDLPNHRKGVGQPKYFNPYRGWQPIQTGDDWLGEIVRTVFFTQTVSEIEHLIDNQSDTLVATYPPFIEKALQDCLPVRMQTGLHFSKSEPVRALDFIRNKALEWTLELEAKGITGKGMSFGETDKKEASVVTNNIYGGNFGVLGSVSGNANASNFVSINNEVSSSDILAFTEKVRTSIPALPRELRSEVEDVLRELENEANSNQLRRSKISQGLSSLRAIMEGATGNLAATGVLAGIAEFIR